ncbi:P63C domain-containing protein [Hymenobacter daeguensis]
MAKQKQLAPTTQPQETTRPAISREEELNEMYAAAAALVESAGLDETLDKENEKRFLAEFKLNNPRLARYIGELQPYVVTFPMEFYEQIYRLHGWSTDPENLRKRPGIVGAWTIKLIYDRFPTGMVDELRSRNPRTLSGDLLHKYFQLLTAEGSSLLKEFIQEAIDLMKQCGSWAHFESVFARKCGKSWQTFLFDNPVD